VEHAIAMADESAEAIGVELLPQHVRGRRWEALPSAAAPAPGARKPLPEAIEEVERSLLLAALEESGWDLPRAAEALGISPLSMRHHVKRLNLAGGQRRTPVVVR